MSKSNAQLSLLVDTADTTGWGNRHNAAVRSPKGIEVAILTLYAGLFEYARECEQEVGMRIGEDHYAGPLFKEIAESLIGLLNMPTGRFDCGTLDRAIRVLCEEAGLELDK